MMSHFLCRSLIAMTFFTVVALAGTAVEAGPTSPMEWTFEGSVLPSGKQLGSAKWQAKDGIISAQAPAGAEGGWLVVDRPSQDTGVYFALNCEGQCDAGVLLRMEKTNDGYKGVYLSLVPDNPGVYRLELDAKGRERTRIKLEEQINGARVAIPAPPGGVYTRSDSASNRQTDLRRPGPPNVVLPIHGPSLPLIKTGVWTDIEAILDTNMLRSLIDQELGPSGIAEDYAGRFGPIALHVGAGTTAQFRGLAITDYSNRVTPIETVGPEFRMQRLSEFYYTWSAAVADFNRDGYDDIVAGPFIYFGPDFTKSREVYYGVTYNPSDQFPLSRTREAPWIAENSLETVATDFTGDGWPDFINIDCCDGMNGGVTLFVNPGKEPRRWDRYKVLPLSQRETTPWVDLFGNGKPVLVYGASGTIRYASPDPKAPTKEWVAHIITEAGPWGRGHGLGVGDINGDGRKDIVTPWGWWEQPAGEPGSQLWQYHPEAFADWNIELGGGPISIYDVNGDGFNDVVTSLVAHGTGLAWFEQKRAANGQISFVRHQIMGDFGSANAGGVTFTQLHGAADADIDGDGVPDFVVGKRTFSSREINRGNDLWGPGVIYWYRTVRDASAPGGARFEPHLIHNRSGVGASVVARDINHDGAIDILTSTMRGTFVFWGKPK